MKLIKRQIEKLEEQQRHADSVRVRLEDAAAARGAASAAGIVWSADEGKLGRDLVAGEHIAYDLLVMYVDGHRVIGTHERASQDPEDLGNVYDEVGRLIGRVWDADFPPLIYWEETEDGRQLRLTAGG